MHILNFISYELQFLADFFRYISLIYHIFIEIA